MRVNKNYILIAIIIFFLTGSIGSNMKFNKTEEKIPFIKHDLALKSSKISGKIHIYNNWSDARDVGICTGDGTYSDPYIIEDLVIDGKNASTCILIEFSDDYFKIENCTLFNSSSSTQDAGIKLVYVSNGILKNNFITENGWGYMQTYGIYINTCDNITLFNNTISKNSRGINLLGSNNINVTQNKISHNSEDGIYLDITNSTILNNVIFNNSDYGLLLFDSDNIVLNNTISYHFHEVYLAYANNNIISMNIISNTNGYGMGVFHNSCNNLIFYNYFISNSPNALDNGFSNQWDNGTIGNYWDDYTGKDTDDDGIGDTIYNIQDSAGSQDNYPIWWDPPVISIISPQIDDINELSPNFNISVDEGITDTIWYSLDDGLTNITFIGLTGKIDETEWNQRTDGQVTINFFANDSRGYIGFNEVTVFKETLTPNITINAPTLNEVFGFNTPEFNITIDDLSPINTTWYTIDGGLTNYIFSELNDFINQTAWDQTEDGVITIKFYANDSLGNLGFKVLNVIKDTALPIITIISPNDNELFGTTAPSFKVEIYDLTLNSMWYTLDNGLTNITFTTNKTIDQSEWDTLPNGTVTIIFYANDSSGYWVFSSVTVRVDKNIPTIVINSPTLNELFRTSAPSFNVEIYDANLDSMWYTLDNGLKNTTFTTNGTINQTLWDTLPEGNVIINFYANDTLGRIGFAEVTIRKDINAPIITINNPQSSDVIGATAPNFDVYIDELNLDKTWYSLNGGNNVTFTGLTGTINQALWDALSEGNVVLRFYANDTFGRIGFAKVTIRKDVTAPIITINNPQSSDVIGATAPNFDVYIDELNLDKTWYSLNGGNNVTFTGLTGTINQALWDALSEGNVVLRFYANDTFGRIGFAKVTIRKDVTAPIITINNPQSSDVIGATAPNFDISIEELNLDKTWYSINGGDNITFTGLTGTINQALWDALPEGNVVLRFYANDTLGRIGFQEVTAVKTISQPSPPGIPGYNILLLLGILSTIAVIIVKKRLK